MTEPIASLELSQAEAFIGKLPTDIEIARQGVNYFQTTVDCLPLKAKGIFLNSLDIQNCFIGTSPEVTSDLDRLSPSQLSELSNILSQTAPNMLLIPHYKGDMLVSVSLLNLKAVRKVIENYPEYFPEKAKTDVRKWLLENKNEWFGGYRDIVGIRYGLLSGFPLTSVLKFCRSVTNYQKGHLDSINENKFLENGFSVWSRACGGYCGYDKEKDLEYVAELDDLREQSGIDAVVEAYEGTEAYLSYYLDQQRAEESIKKIVTIAEALTHHYPQFTNGKLNYVITGSLALKLAIIANRIDWASLIYDGSRVNYHVEAPPFPYTKHGFTPSDQFLSVIEPPKDIDIIPVIDFFIADQRLITNNRATFLRFQENCPPHDTEIRVVDQEKGLIVDRVTQGRIANSIEGFQFNPSLLERLVEVTIGDKKFVIQDPLAILAFRDYSTDKKDRREEGFYQDQTRAYREEIKRKWPELFRD